MAHTTSACGAPVARSIGALRSRCACQSCSSALGNTADSSKRPQSLVGARTPCPASWPAISWQWPRPAGAHVFAAQSGAQSGAVSKQVIVTSARTADASALSRLDFLRFIPFSRYPAARHPSTPVLATGAFLSESPVGSREGVLPRLLLKRFVRNAHREAPTRTQNGRQLARRGCHLPGRASWLGGE